MATTKNAKPGHPTRGETPQTIHVSVKFTDEEGRAIDQATVQRRVSKSDLVREGLAAIGVLRADSSATRTLTFEVGGPAGDSLRLQFSPEVASRLAYDILAAVHHPRRPGSFRVRLRGRLSGKPPDR